MTVPIVTISYNNAEDDINPEWIELDPVNDQIAFCGSSIRNGDLISIRDSFEIPEIESKEIPIQAVKNYESGTYKRVYLAGSNANSGFGGNYKHAYRVFIEGETSSSPVLQAWDSTSCSTINLQLLGSGTPANSMIRAVATKDYYGAYSPGELWAGSPIAGDDPAYSLLLGIPSPPAGGGVSTYYFNMRVLVPPTATPFACTPVLAIYFTYS